MNGIEQYIDATIEDYEETIDFCKRHNYQVDNIQILEDIVATLKSRNMDSIISMIEADIERFYRTPMAEYFFRNRINLEILYGAADDNLFRYAAFRYISLEELFSDEYLKKWLDNLSQADYDNFIRGRFNYLQKDTYEYIKTLLERFSAKEELLRELREESIKQYVVQTPDVAKLLIEDLSAKDSYLTGEDYQILWDNNCEDFHNLSQFEKLESIRKIKEKNLPLATTMFADLNLLDDRELIGANIKDLLPLCDEETKKDLFYSYIESDKDAGFIMDQLSLESQQEIIKSPRFLDSKIRKSNLDSILDALHPELFKTKIDKELVATPDRLIKFYERTQDELFIETAKNKLLSAESATIYDDWIRSKSLCDYLNENDKKELAKLLTFPSNPVELKEFFSHVSMFKEKNYFIGVICANAMKVVRENNDLEFSIYRHIENLFDETELKDIFFSLNKSKQLEEINSFSLSLKLVYEALKENPNFYQGVDFKRSDFSFFTLDEDSRKGYIEYIFSCLDENQRDIFYKDSVLEAIPSMQEAYRAYVLSNPPNLSRVIEKFFSDEELQKIYQECSVEVFTSAYSNSILAKDTSYYDRRLDDLIAGVNSNKVYFGSWLKNLSTEGLDNLLNNINGSRIIELLTNFKEKNMRKKIFDVIIKRVATGDLLETAEYKFKSLFTNSSREEISYLITNLDNFSLVMFLNKIRVNVLEKEFMLRVKNGTIDLGQSEIVCLLPKVLLTISTDNKSYISGIIENQFNAMTQFPKLKAIVSTMDSVAKASFIYAVNNGLINENNIDLVIDMIQKDPFLLNNMDTRLLRADVMEMGEHFTRKTSRYPNVVYKLMTVFDSNPELSKFLVAVSKHLMSTEASYDTYDSKMEIIITFLAQYDLASLNDITLDENVLANFEDYIIQQYRIVQQKASNNPSKYAILDSKFKCDISNYHNERKTYLDQMINEVQDINELRNLFYNRYFWLDYGAVQNFMYSYADNYDDVCEYAQSDLPLKYINLIRKIEAIEDFATLVELYNSMTEEYSISDYMTIEGIMKNAYNKANAEVVNRRLMGEMVTKEITVDGKKVRQEMLEVTAPYGLFVHSTDAYGAMEMINDNYFDSWNYNSNTENHGICTCYITNTSYGTAAVKGNGVMFGFNRINEHSIATMGPYDLVTRNVGYTITSNRPPLYMRMDKVSSYTRHTHNEFDLERRNDTLEKRYSCIQPDCVVIFEDMPEEIKANSLKAVEDFRARGIELQIVYIDRVKNMRHEGDLISKGLEEYSTTHDLSLLAHIIDRYESNLCGSDFFKDIDVKEILSTTELEMALDETVQYLRSISNIDVRNAKIEQFISILSKEQVKFDLIQETVGERAHKFDLYSDSLKEKINELLSLTQAQLENEAQKAVA